MRLIADGASSALALPRLAAVGLARASACCPESSWPRRSNAELHRRSERTVTRSSHRAISRSGAGSGRRRRRFDARDARARRTACASSRAFEVRRPPAGERAIVRGRLEPFDEARNPGEPSEREIERERGFDGRLDGAQILSMRFVNRRKAPETWLARAHAWAHASCSDRLGEPAASVVAGELWGERSAFPPALRSRVSGDGNGSRLGYGRLASRRGRGARVGIASIVVAFRAGRRALRDRASFGYSSGGAARSCRRCALRRWRPLRLRRAPAGARRFHGTRSRSPHWSWHSRGLRASRRLRLRSHFRASARFSRAPARSNGGWRRRSRCRIASARRWSFRIATQIGVWPLGRGGLSCSSRPTPCSRTSPSFRASR